VNPSAALRAAFGDFYHQLWRLFVLNSLLSAVVLGVLLLALWAPVALVALVLVGPLAAALMHCAVSLAQTEELRLSVALSGLRLHWRRGLALAALGLVALGFTLLAVLFYGGRGTLLLPLAIVAAYVLALFALFQLVLWPLAVFERAMPLRAVLRLAAEVALGRPRELVVLGAVLLLVNLAGVAAAVLPFLTLTVAYTFLAAAHFALPRNPLREAIG
jgi:hypothetical protein